MKSKMVLAIVMVSGVMMFSACGESKEEAPLNDDLQMTDNSDSSSDASSDEEERHQFAGPWVTYVNPEEGEGNNEEENERDNTDVKGKVYSKIIVTGIEEWQSVGYSIAGFMDGSAFAFNGIGPSGEMINADYSPGTPDRFELSFDTETGEAISAIYYGNYPDEESAMQGVEALNENSSLFGGDIISVSADGSTIEVSFNPSSAHINQGIRTYFLEGRHDPEGYTDYCEDIFKNANSIYSTFKGENYACEVIQGIKVTWYE